MTRATDNYEKLGAFYLGRSIDLESGTVQDEPLLYDSRDLTTHAMCVGMTGSGKTGLCIGLLEEAAIDGIPSLVIDPKGDLTNLLLTFPDLRPQDFEPWVNPDDARRKGQTPAEYARSQADLWKGGLADWDQDGDRIGRLRQAADFTIFTPGSDAGVPVSILASFAAPPPELLGDKDMLRDRIASTVTSLLGLLKIDADPLRSRDHILLSTILDRAWQQGTSLDLGALIQLIQKPPVTRVGVLDLESFYPSKERFELALALNNLLAAPGFATWMSGEPLDVDRMLYTPDGKPRVSIFCIAHLSDAERMFFVSLLLNETVGWMRSRSGTTSLRALLYMDEIFGYMPPVAEPPSKRPLLTLLKQARAYGVGVVLATQNPVDLDYKGLSNCGTWFLGRLQTERDKNRVLDGLEGVAAGGGATFDRGRLEQVLAGLGKRVFLMHNVHESGPTTFQTRWVMSYLRGPMTRPQIRTLTAATRPPESGADAGVAPTPAATRAAPVATAVEAPPSGAPVLPPEVVQVWLPALHGGSEGLVYRPRLLGVGHIQYVDTRKGLEASEPLAMLAAFDDGPRPVDWGDAARISLSEDDLESAPPMTAPHTEVPGAAAKPRNYTGGRRRSTTGPTGISGTRSFEAPSSRSTRIRGRPSAISGSGLPTERARRGTSVLTSCVRSTGLASTVCASVFARRSSRSSASRNKRRGRRCKQ